MIDNRHGAERITLDGIGIESHLKSRALDIAIDYVVGLTLSLP